MKGNLPRQRELGIRSRKKKTTHETERPCGITNGFRTLTEFSRCFGFTRYVLAGTGYVIRYGFLIVAALPLETQLELVPGANTASAFLFAAPEQEE